MGYLLNVDAEKMRLVYRFVSNEETRYYLNGVFVEPCKHGGVTITATDGHRLVSAHDPLGFIDEARIIALPKETLAAIKKSNNKSKRTLNGADIRLEVNLFASSGSSVAAITGNGDVSCFVSVINGTFPEYRRVIPARADGAPAAFNTSYLGDYDEISKSIIIHQNGRAAAVIDFGRDDFTGVLMPIRFDESKPTFLS